MKFRDAPSVLDLPGWMRARVTSRVLYMGGLILDALGDMMTGAVKIRFPSVDQPDALPYIGRDRNLDRGPFETDASFVQRSTEAFDTWATAGHPRELLTNLLAYLQPNVPVLRAIGDLSIWDTWASGTLSTVYASNWNWDYATKFVRGWVVLYGPFKSEGTWGDGALWGDGGTWGSTASSSAVTALRNITKKWKGGHERVINIIVSFDPAKFDPAQPAGGGINPDGRFGRPYASVGGVATPVRFSDCAFWDGVS